ncbi:hypothetical protein BSNK01_27350 [Bacillaceae bacterium]
MRNWIPCLVWMGVIFYFSSQTSGSLQTIFPFFRDFDWGHFVAYFILALTYYYALLPYQKRIPIYWTAIVLSMAYGLTDEIHQYFVPTRTADVRDLMNDTIGASAAMVCMHVYNRLKKTANRAEGSKNAS